MATEPSQQRGGGPQPLRLGITGAGGLQAREVADLLPASPLSIPVPPAIHHFAAAEESAAPAGPAAQPRSGPRHSIAHRLATIGGEPVVLESLDAEAIAGLDAIFFTAGAAETRLWAPRAAAAGALAVDLTSALDPAPGPRPNAATWRYPEPQRASADDNRSPAAASNASVQSRAAEPLRVPHPAAQALAAVLPALAALGVQHTAAVVFQPASERGLAGIEELRDQSLRLLAVQSLPTAVFGGQIAFNLRFDLGEEVRPSLAEIAAIIAADLRSLAAGSGFVLPALQVIQAPIFHAHVISLLAVWDDPPAPERLAGALRAAPAVFYPAGQPQPDAVTGAGENGVQIGAPQPDRSHPGAFWIPVSADNLRLRAAAALHLAARALSRL